MNALGREPELARIGTWLSREAAPGPAGTVLVIEGEPGIGKTTLWTEAVRQARRAGWEVLSCRPGPLDAGLPHLAMADLLRSVPAEAFAGLPSPQRRPLEVALLREEAGESDLEPRAVSTGLTALLGLLAGRQPLMLAVDDAQWLDHASARSLAFALRRLDDHPLRLLTALRVEAAPDHPAARDHPAAPRRAPDRAAPDHPATSPDHPAATSDPAAPDEHPAGRGDSAFATVAAALDHQRVQRLPVGPLSVAATHHMFLQALGASFARPVLVRIHRAAAGNPFYALEIAREVHRAGEPSPGEPLPVPADHRDLALVRLRRLPPAALGTLAAVAAMSRPTAGRVDLSALAPAERAGIVKVRPDGRVEFTHPLFGNALYSSLAEADRRALHRDLAAAAPSLEERARHLALAAAGPDEQTAAVLDRAAEAAGARGAAEAAVELAELAHRLTPPADRPALVRRELALAERRYFAGDPTGARRQLERSLAALPPGEDRARVLLELGSILWVQAEGDQGLELMSRALTEAGSRSLRARIHSRIASQSDDADLAVKHGEAALALLDEHEDPVMYCFALHNLALFKLLSGRGADHQAIEKGMSLQRDLAAWEMSTVPAFWARAFDDFGTARQRFEDLLRAFREKGDEATASGVLTHLAVVEAMTGRMDRARALAAEALDLAGQTEQDTYLNMALFARGQVCARAGELDQARAAGQEILRRLGGKPDIVLEGMARAVLGMAAMAAGDLAEADRQFSRAQEIEEQVHNREPASNRFHADHAEAVIGLGDLDRAESLVCRMEARARALPRPWILAAAARSRGLLHAASGDLDAALASYDSALGAHERLDMPAELGRTLLAKGRLHRRRNERQLARQALERAVAVFTAAGARSWAEVAEGELHRAQGRRGSRQRLTPTERHIAELALSGLRNHEIAARLFLSRKTVEANLSRAYAKLGIRSRAELARHLTPAGEETGQP